MGGVNVVRRALRVSSAAHMCRLIVVLCFFSVFAVLLGSAHARKELPINAPYPPVLQDALRCDVCSFVVTNALYQVEAKRGEIHGKRLAIREDDILEEIDNMCVPFKDQGQWIRQVALRVEENSSSRNEKGTSPRYHIVMGVVDYYSKCGRICATVAALCEEWMDSEALDGFSGRLLREANKRKNISSAAAREALFKNYCKPSPYCKKRRSLVEKVERLLSQNKEMRDAIEEDQLVKMDNEEREMETMLHRLTREQGQSAEVFSRDEIHRMKDAFVKGNKEDVQAIDPKAFDLSDEEFVTLQEYMREEAGKVSPHRPGSPTEEGDL